MTDPQSAPSSRPRSEKPGHLSAIHLKAVAAGAALALVVTVGVNVQAGGTSTTSTAGLASSYIAAIGTANAALGTADVKLKALPVGATSAQVNAIVAPLGPALKPLEALVASTETPVSPTTTPKAPLSTNLVLNGDFSSPYVGGSGSFETFQPESLQGMITSWIVRDASVNVLGHGYLAMPASWPKSWQAVDLSDNGSITQQMGTKAGSTYSLGWYATGNPGCGQSPKVMHVLWDNTLIASVAISTSGRNNSSVVWSPESRVVVAVASLPHSVLEFADASPDKSNCGAVVADVWLTAVR